jgi:hypothetical protein
VLDHAFVQKGEALDDAEAVLLVHDDEAELVELDVFLEEGVGADDDVGEAGGELRFDELFAFGPDAADEAVGADAEGLQELLEDVVVLLGEDLGGDEEGDLVAAADGGVDGGGGDDGFAGADVSLEEAVHGSGEVHIRVDLGEGPVLGGGEGEGEGAAELGEVVGFEGVGDAGEGVGEGLFAEGEGALEAEELIEDEAAAGGFEGLGGVWEVGLA